MKRSNYLLILLAAAIAFASCAKEELRDDNGGHDLEVNALDQGVEKGWVRIKLTEDTEPLRVGAFTRGEMNSGYAQLDEIAAELGATEIRSVFQVGGEFEERHRKHGLHLWFDIRIDEEVSVTRAVTNIKSLNEIAVVEPIYKRYLVGEEQIVMSNNLYQAPDMTPAAEIPFDDPRLSEQWHYYYNGAAGFSPFGSINLLEAWEYEKGKPNVIVSVHDEGVNKSHEDLAAHIWVNPNPGKPGEPYAGDINGWNFTKNIPEVDIANHGTHTSGTISAVNNNNKGVCGVAGGSGAGDGVRIMPLQILPDGIASDVSSFVYAADRGAVISQNSWSLNRTGNLPIAYETAFNYFIKNAGVDKAGNQTGPMKGGVILFATGNKADYTQAHLPASSDLVIGVAASNHTGNVGSYSNCGIGTDMVAPGGLDGTGGGKNILSLSADGYMTMWGTSMACPHASGVAALIVSYYGGEGFTAEECKERLLRSCNPMGGIMDDIFLGKVGAGMLDASLAFVEDPQAAPDKVGLANVAIKNNMMTLSWSVPNDANNLPVAEYTIEYITTNKEGIDDTPVTIEEINMYAAGQTVSKSIRVPYNRDIKIDITAIDRWGNESEKVSLTAATGDYVNRAPSIRKEFPELSIPNVGDANIQTLLLSDYFYDPDISDGDVLTYTVVNNAENVVAVEANEEGNLVVTPIARGEVSVVVKATDLAGENVSQTLSIKILAGPNPMGGATVTTYPNPAESVINVKLSGFSDGQGVKIQIFDSASRRVQEATVNASGGVATVNVSKLNSGMYTLVATKNGVKAASSFIKK